MSYPFANNPYAQSAANRNDRYHDPYDNSADHTYNQYAPYSEDHDQDHPSQAYTDQRRRYDDEELEDEGYHDDMHRGASGRGPPPAGYADGGPTEKYGSTPGYAPAGPVALRGKSIWQREDKNAFAQRSLPAKCFR